MRRHAAGIVAAAARHGLLHRQLHRAHRLRPSQPCLLWETHLCHLGSRAGVVINQGYLSDRCSSVLPRPAFLGVSLALMGGAQLLLALSVPAGALS